MHAFTSFHPLFIVSVSILDSRQKRAEELRRLTDKSASMSEEQLTELRAEIKVDLMDEIELSLCRHLVPSQFISSSSPQHFVSERKYDEDLGKAVRFTFDLEPMKTSIVGFGSGGIPSSVSLTIYRNLVPLLVC